MPSIFRYRFAFVHRSLPRAARAVACLLAGVALAGCQATLHGHHAPGSAVTSTAAASHAHASFGSVRIGASFGTAAPAGAPGGHLSLSHGAAAVVLVGLLVAEVVNYLAAAPATEAQGAPDPRRPILETCSCYGYRPPSTLTAASAAE